MLTPDIEDALREFTIDAPPLPRRILLVDDEHENLESLLGLLEDEYEVLTAQSGQEALHLLQTVGGVDLVVADQRMPEMSGVELLTQIAAQSPDTVRIILTAYDDVGPMMAALNRSFVFRFLIKPCSPQGMRCAIAEGLSIQHANRLLRHFIQASVERQEQLDRTIEKLASAQRYLVDAERLTTVGRAASGILHEVRNLGTLTSIVVGEIQSALGEAHALAAGRSTLHGFASLVNLLEAITAFARIGDAAVERVPTDVVALLHQTVTLAALQEHSRNCPVEIHVEPGLERLEVDRARTRHAITALLANALRASSPGTPITINVSTTLARPNIGAGHASWVAVEICDRGCGMDNATRDCALSPLFSGFSPPGLGLGLCAAQVAAEIQGGELALESTQGQGTRATLLLPRELCLRNVPFPNSEDRSAGRRDVGSAHARGRASSSAEPTRQDLGVSAKSSPIHVYCGRFARALFESVQGIGAQTGPKVECLAPNLSPEPQPGILVLEVRDLRGDERNALRSFARLVLPGSPIIIGGSDDRETVLEAINEWHAFRLLPDTTPIAVILEAIQRANELLQLKLSVRRYANDLVTICARLANTLDELEATRERLLHTERLSSLGSTLSALTARMREQSVRLNVFCIEAARMALGDGVQEETRQRLSELLRHLGEARGSFDAMLADMLLVAEKRSSELELDVADLDGLVARTVRLFRYDPLGAERQIHLDCSSNCQVRVDTNRLRHALLNLLRNAAQATTPTDRIGIRARADHAMAIIEVEDSGVGMTSATLARLGTEFFTTKGKDGIGLGLRLTRAVVERHGGTLNWESTLGKGSLFRICLPVSNGH